jgi:hypothetical protein
MKISDKNSEKLVLNGLPSARIPRNHFRYLSGTVGTMRRQMPNLTRHSIHSLILDLCGLFVSLFHYFQDANENSGAK